MNKKITIIIESENGEHKQISAFSNNKIQWLSETKQWEYVLNEIILSYDNGIQKKLFDNIQRDKVSQ